MATPESLREIAHARTPFSAWVGVVILFAIFGAIVLAVIGPSQRGADYEEKRAQVRQKKLKDLHDEEAKALTGYGWVDKTKGVAHVPIERAMQLSVAELAQKKPMAAGPIATPQPASVESTPAAATPAAKSTVTPAPKASPTPTGTPKPTSVAGPESAARGQPAAAVNPETGPVHSPAKTSPTPTPKP
ncbi:MAG: hypothetical protein ABI925_12675 [Verrucomicrobiota bacterium]